MIQIHDLDEVKMIGESARIVGHCLLMLSREVRPGVSTLELDRLAEAFIRDSGGTPAFKGYRGFPASICASINEEVVHGIPPVGEVSSTATRLLEVTQKALEAGIAQARPGNRVSDISAAIEREVTRSRFRVVRALVGHGIGRELHEEPQVPNYGRMGEGPKLREGMVLAIEPMVNAGTAEVLTLSDQWTVVTADRSLSAHFEHTVAIGAEGPVILSKVEAD